MNQRIDQLSDLGGEPFSAVLLAELNPDTGTKSYRRVAYDAGSFTPAFTFDTPGDLNPGHSIQVGTYRKIGRLVFFGIQLTWTPTHSTASGGARFTGLPFPVKATTGIAIGFVRLATTNAWPAGVSQLVISLATGASYAVISGQGSALGSLATMGAAHFATGVPNSLRMQGFYESSA